MIFFLPGISIAATSGPAIPDTPAAAHRLSIRCQSASTLSVCRFSNRCGRFAKYDLPLFAGLGRVPGRPCSSAGGSN
jgi:hypothetical protein